MTGAGMLADSGFGAAGGVGGGASSFSSGGKFRRCSVLDLFDE